MRVDNKSVDTLANASGLRATQRVAQQDSKLSPKATGATGSDQASLSNATDLIALARNATSSARQAKISALTEQVRAGRYQGDVGQAGRGMVGELLLAKSSAAS